MSNSRRVVFSRAALEFYRATVSWLGLVAASSFATAACAQAPSGAQSALARPVPRGVGAERSNTIVQADKALSAENSVTSPPQLVVRLTDADVVAKARALSDKAGHGGLHYDYYRFAAAIDKVQQTHADMLDIPKDTYHIYPPIGFPNSHGLINLADLSHVVVEGNGSNLLFTSIGNATAPLDTVHPRAGIQIARSDHLTLRNLVMDWEEPLAVPVRVIGKFGPEQKLVVDPAFPINPASPMPIRVFKPFDVPHRSFGLSRAMSPAEFAAWTAAYQGGSGMGMPYTCQAPISGISSSTCFRFVGGQTYAFGPNERFGPIPPHDGNFLATVRDNNFGAIILDGGSSYLTIEGVTVYSSPGAGLQLVNAGDAIHVSHLQITRKPDQLLRPGEQPRFISTLADGINVISSGGDVVIENSEIGFVTDDGINIRSDMRVGKATAPGTIQVTSAAVENYYRAGRLIDVYTNGARDLVTRNVTVSQVIPPAPGQSLYTLVLGSGSPRLRVGEAYQVRNHDWDNGRVVLRNTWIHDNSERGVVVHGSDIAIINNRFDRTAECAIELLFDNTGDHPEGPIADNVIVSGNIVHDVNVEWFNVAKRSFAVPAAIAAYFATRSAFGVNDKLVPGNVVAHHLAITDNVIDSVPGTGILVSQADDVVLERNRVSMSGQHTFGIPLIDGKAIVVEYTTGLRASGNVADASIVLPNQ
jgi:hypothetical protein